MHMHIRTAQKLGIALLALALALKILIPIWPRNANAFDDGFNIIGLALILLYVFSRNSVPQRHQPRKTFLALGIVGIILTIELTNYFNRTWLVTTFLVTAALVVQSVIFTRSDSNHKAQTIGRV